jgi:hypothetical protein
MTNKRPCGDGVGRQGHRETVRRSLSQRNAINEGNISLTCLFSGWYIFVEMRKKNNIEHL